MSTPASWQIPPWRRYGESSTTIHVPQAAAHGIQAFCSSPGNPLELSVGAQVQARECTRRKANFYVVFTPDPAKTLKYLKWHPKLLFDRDARIGQINQFLADSTPLPVRVWHNGEEIGRNGMPVRTNIYRAGYDSGSMPTNGGGAHDFAVVHAGGGFQAPGPFSAAPSREW